ncbi:MAG: glycosyltransferase family 4 protein [Henriciella sp.]|nr:glycosyltransferase family 4 protein [Hyphomonadaceae bacterium]
MSQNEPVRRADLDEYRRRLGPRHLMVERSMGDEKGLLPQRYSAALKAFSQRQRYDQMLVLSEDMGFILAGLLARFGWKGRLHIIVHAGQGSRRRRFFKWTDGKIVESYIVFCERQRQVLVEEVGINSAKVHTLLNPVDTVFFDPARVAMPASAGGYVFACGLENRDYHTLSKAAALTDLSYLIQATGYFVEDTDGTDRPANVDVRKQRVSFERLREMYHQSAFVVVPLNSVDYAAGVNGILEAMAMGKAVVAMQSPGLEDYFSAEGVRVVPPKDPQALAAAMTDLHASPELCADLGAKNRAWVTAHCEVSDYADKVAALMGLQS